MKPRHAPRTAPLIASLVVAIAAVTLILSTVTFLRSYRSSIVESARTSSAQAVSQVVGTVGDCRQQPQHQKNEQILRYSFPFFVAAHGIPSLGLVMYMQVGTRLYFACGFRCSATLRQPIKKDLPQGGRS